MHTAFFTADGVFAWTDLTVDGDCVFVLRGTPPVFVPEPSRLLDGTLDVQRGARHVTDPEMRFLIGRAKASLAARRALPWGLRDLVIRTDTTAPADTTGLT